MKNLSMVQQLEAKRIGAGGQVLGMLFGMVVLAWLRLWYWLPFLVFTIIILVVEFISVSQQLRQARKLQRLKQVI